jgi:hypothetical protein
MISDAPSTHRNLPEFTSLHSTAAQSDAMQWMTNALTTAEGAYVEEK